MPAATVSPGFRLAEAANRARSAAAIERTDGLVVSGVTVPAAVERIGQPHEDALGSSVLTPRPQSALVGSAVDLTWPAAAPDLNHRRTPAGRMVGITAHAADATSTTLGADCDGVAVVMPGEGRAVNLLDELRRGRGDGMPARGP